ncbi:GNAT family N-acetyltransferase [Guptibacillus algicola]|uniref:GNAT family N-acetyltransferase n=1 Tax=Guptibacillus algicola TaxID=225844 RepID=UPI001CD74493|nr:hypothetical protein [Alkalihalobacillus algicola]MCA0988983.1 hypothetical protein [Alkalihalobacillus algicola]
MIDLFLVREATSEDEETVKNMVRRSGLEVDLLPDIESFLIAETEAKELFGVIGLEKYGRSGLLRALVLNSAESTSERLLRFFDQVIAYAKKCSLDELYLTSNEESFFFQVFGFSTISREELSVDIKQNRLFSGDASNRVIMRRQLNF